MENPINGSGTPGSPFVPAPNLGQGQPAGQTQMPGGNFDYKKAYEELVPKLGEQGKELGSYREFVENLSPFLEELDSMPELVQAINDKKIDVGLAKAILEGRVSIADAQVASQASADVKKELGKKEYNQAAPEDVSRLIEERIGVLRQEISEKNELDSFQEYTQNFIANTPDFAVYSADVDKWLDSHDVSDIEVAYYAVKGQLSEKKAKEQAEAAKAEEIKRNMLNATGGGIHTNYSEDGVSLADRLISGRPNPNSLF